MYGLGDVANTIKMSIFGLYTVFFSTTVMGVPGMWVGVVGLVALVWDAVIDPYVGYLSDKARIRFGRRHTFMLVECSHHGRQFLGLL